MKAKKSFRTIRLNQHTPKSCVLPILKPLHHPSCSTTPTDTLFAHLEALPNGSSQTLTFRPLISQSSHDISCCTHSCRLEGTGELAEKGTNIAFDKVWAETNAKTVRLEDAKVLLNEAENTGGNSAFV